MARLHAQADNPVVGILPGWRQFAKDTSLSAVSVVALAVLVLMLPAGCLIALKARQGNLGRSQSARR